MESCLVCIRLVVPIVLVGFCVGTVGMVPMVVVVVVTVVVMVVEFEVFLRLGMVRIGMILMVDMLELFSVIVGAVLYLVDRMKFGMRWIWECVVP